MLIKVIDNDIDTLYSWDVIISTFGNTNPSHYFDYFHEGEKIHRLLSKILCFVFGKLYF